MVEICGILWYEWMGNVVQRAWAMGMVFVVVYVLVYEYTRRRMSEEKKKTYAEYANTKSNGITTFVWCLMAAKIHRPHITSDTHWIFFLYTIASPRALLTQPDWSKRSRKEMSPNENWFGHKISTKFTNLPKRWERTCKWGVCRRCDSVLSSTHRTAKSFFCWSDWHADGDNVVATIHTIHRFCWNSMKFFLVDIYIEMNILNASDAYKSINHIKWMFKMAKCTRHKNQNIKRQPSHQSTDAISTADWISRIIIIDCMYMNGGFECFIFIFVNCTEMRAERTTKMMEKRETSLSKETRNY